MLDRSAVAEVVRVADWHLGWAKESPDSAAAPHCASVGQALCQLAGLLWLLDLARRERGGEYPCARCERWTAETPCRSC